jgi:hypothetical protein
MVEEETKTAAGEIICVVGNSPDEAPAEWWDDEDTPDRPSTADDVNARFDLTSMQSPRRAMKEDDPRVRLLDCAERMLIAPSEREPDPSGACEPVGGAARLA